MSPAGPLRPTDMSQVLIAPETNDELAAYELELTPTGVPVVFRRLLTNTLVTGVTSSFLWFALTFWVYLETRSVVATGVIGGAFSISSAVFGPLFGTFVDRHRKHTAMVLTTAVSAVCFTVATAVFVAVDSSDLLRLAQPLVLGAGALHAVRLGGRPDARDRAVDHA